MALTKIQMLIVVIALFIPMLYSVEATVGECPSEDLRRGLGEKKEKGEKKKHKSEKSETSAAAAGAAATGAVAGAAAGAVVGAAATGAAPIDPAPTGPAVPGGPTTTGPAVPGGPTTLLDTIPKFELYLMKVMKHIDEGPVSTPAETCLVDCLKTYDKEIEELKKFATAAAGKFKSTIDKAALTHCDQCLADVSKADPRVGQDIEWFTREIEAASAKMCS